MTSWQALLAREALRVRPFRGVRFAPSAGDLETLTLRPPMSWASRAEELTELPAHHILRLLSPVFDGDPSSGARDVRRQVDAWLRSGVLHRDDEPALYVYQQAAGSETVVGIIAAADVAGDRLGLLDHEEVIEELVETQEAFERNAHAQVEPILALHRRSAVLSRLLATVIASSPETVVTDAAGTIHRLWAVIDPDVQDKLLAAIPDEPALIADGHHRHAAWRRAASGDPDEPRRWALCLLTDAEQPGIRLGAVHRVVSGLRIDQVIGSDALMVSPLGDRGAATDYLRNGPIARCVVYGDGRYYAVTPAHLSEICAAPELAVCHLHSHWFVQWEVAERDVAYVHELDQAVELARNDRVAFLLPVAGLAEVRSAAMESRPLPRKATSFGPKPLLGLVFRSWNHD